MSRYLLINRSMRRKAGALVPLEVAILEAAVSLRDRGTPEFHGYAIATKLAEEGAARRLTAYGTLYRALGRLEERGLLLSHWEDTSSEESQGRPRRRLYAVTAPGELALSRAPTAGREGIARGRGVRLDEALGST